MLRIILWVLVLFVLLPTVGMLVLGTMLSDSYTQLTPQFGHVNSSLDLDDGIYEIEGVDEVLNSTLPGGRFKPNFKALAKFGDINTHRVVRFSTVINPRTLLKENEDLPKKEFLDVFVEARGIRYGHEECERLLEILASKCVVQSSQGSSDSSGNYKMTFSLNFVQKEEFGTVGAGTHISYHEVSHNFKIPPRRIDEWGFKAEKERATLYEKMKEQCDLLVESEGNCAISRISINSYRIRRGTRQEATNGIVLYSFLSSDGKVKKSPDAKGD